MAAYDTNISTSFVNRNESRSFKIPLTTTLVALSAQLCTEAVLYNKTGQDILVYDNNYFDSANEFLLADGDSFVVRGITNSDQVSAKTSTGSGNLYLRTQFYSNFSQQ